MKKRKKATNTSPEPRTKVLVPLVSKKEADPGFVARACSSGDELVLLLVVDTAAMPGQFGFAASEIAQGNALMQEIIRIAKGNGCSCNDIIEWGETEGKIIHFVQLLKIPKVILVKQDNPFFKKLVKELQEKTSAEVEAVSVQEML